LDEAASPRAGGAVFAVLIGVPMRTTLPVVTDVGLLNA
jgi:hypothetical protein